MYYQGVWEWMELRDKQTESGELTKPDIQPFSIGGCGNKIIEVS
jgi:hypothetical protein